MFKSSKTVIPPSLATQPFPEQHPNGGPCGTRRWSRKRQRRQPWRSARGAVVKALGNEWFTTDVTSLGYIYIYSYII